VPALRLTAHHHHHLTVQVPAGERLIRPVVHHHYCHHYCYHHPSLRRRHPAALVRRPRLSSLSQPSQVTKPTPTAAPHIISPVNPPPIAATDSFQSGRSLAAPRCGWSRPGCWRFDSPTETTARPPPTTPAAPPCCSSQPAGLPPAFVASSERARSTPSPRPQSCIRLPGPCSSGSAARRTTPPSRVLRHTHTQLYIDAPQRPSDALYCCPEAPRLWAARSATSARDPARCGADAVAACAAP